MQGPILGTHRKSRGRSQHGSGDRPLIRLLSSIKGPKRASIFCLGRVLVFASWVFLLFFMFSRFCLAKVSGLEVWGFKVSGRGFGV